MLWLFVLFALGRVDVALTSNSSITPTTLSDVWDFFGISKLVECPPYPAEPKEKIGTTFTYYDKTHSGYPILKYPDDCPKNATKIVMLIHGFLASPNAFWYGNLTNIFLPLNITLIYVDWSNGTNTLNYLQAVANARVVANETAKMIKNCGIDVTIVTIIGHSIGAHIAGMVGYHIKILYHQVLEKIIGMDPAAPCYDNSKDLVGKLNKGDGGCVFYIVSDSTGFGTRLALGDLNYFYEGGCYQKGCGLESLSNLKSLYPNFEENAPQVMKNVSFCNHIVAIKVVVQSLRFGSENCTVKAYPTTDDNAYAVCLKGVSSRISFLASFFEKEPVFRAFLVCGKGTYILVSAGEDYNVCQSTKSEEKMITTGLFGIMG